jgi:hypothetical protein
VDTTPNGYAALLYVTSLTGLKTVKSKINKKKYLKIISSKKSTEKTV